MKTVIWQPDDIELKHHQFDVINEKLYVPTNIVKKIVVSVTAVSFLIKSTLVSCLNVFWTFDCYHVISQQIKVHVISLVGSLVGWITPAISCQFWKLPHLFNIHCLLPIWKKVRFKDTYKVQLLRKLTKIRVIGHEQKQMKASFSCMNVGSCGCWLR